MALLFFQSPEEPVRCALDIRRELKNHPQIQVRMGIHSGPVNQVRDVNDTINVAGAGINVAQRVMDCGDAGHILVSKHVADDLPSIGIGSRICTTSASAKRSTACVSICLISIRTASGIRHSRKLKRRPRWKQPAGRRHPAHSRTRWPNWALAVAVLLSATAIAVTIAFFFHRGPPPLLVPEKSIAVLPFQNLSSEKENAYFMEGVQDEILTDLARVADLKVISRTSVMQYPGRCETQPARHCPGARRCPYPGRQRSARRKPGEGSCAIDRRQNRHAHLG